MLTKCALAAIFVLQVCWAIPYDLTPRITEGEDAMPGEFPYQVSIQLGLGPDVGYSHLCSGSILNEWYILTLAHCIRQVGKMKVIAGKYYLDKNETIEQTREITKTFVHDQYEGSFGQHDIALFKLEEPLIFNSKIQPIKLPAQGQTQEGEAILSGWGTTEKDHFPSALSNKLQKAVVPILCNEECLKELKCNLTDEQPELFSTQVCSGTDGKEVAGRTGDYGNPLAQGHGADAVQVGIFTKGVWPCGSRPTPSIYTRVASYIDWIHRCMDEQTSTPATLTTPDSLTTPATLTTPAVVPEVTTPTSSATTVTISFLNKFAIICIAVILNTLRL